MKLWNDIQKKIDFKTGSSILVVGTEEFMYPALFIGSCIEKKGCTVRSHSTTRSPIEVCQGRNLNIAGLDEKIFILFMRGMSFAVCMMMKEKHLFMI